MKTFLVMALGFMVNLEANAQPAVKLVEYRFEIMPAGTGTSAWFYKNNAALATASNVLYGPGLTGSTGYTAGVNALPDLSQWADNWNTVFDANDYYSVTLTPTVGYILVIDSISFWGRRSGTGPTNIQLRSSANSYSSTIWIGTNGGTNVWKRQKITAGLPMSATPLTFRMYGYTSTGTAGTWRIDTLRVFGHLDGVFNLPITLLSFTGEKDGDGVRFDWTTASERDNDYFTILRSKDGWNFEEVTRVPGAGNSTSPIPYWTRDAKPYDGLNYYRLRQTDIDGTQVDHVDKTIMVVFSRTFGTLAHILTITGQETRGSPSELPPGVYIFEDTEGHTQQVLVTSWR